MFICSQSLHEIKVFAHMFTQISLQQVFQNIPPRHAHMLRVIEPLPSVSRCDDDDDDDDDDVLFWAVASVQ